MRRVVYKSETYQRVFRFIPKCLQVSTNVLCIRVQFGGEKHAQLALENAGIATQGKLGECGGSHWFNVYYDNRFPIEKGKKILLNKVLAYSVFGNWNRAILKTTTISPGCCACFESEISSLLDISNRVHLFRYKKNWTT